MTVSGRKKAKNSYKTRGHAILDRCEDWQEGFFTWDEDCRMVSSFYSGKKVETEEDEDTLGLVQHANYQTGRQRIQQAKEEELASFLNVRTLMRFRLKQYDPSLPPTAKKQAEEIFTKIVDKLVREKDTKLLYELDLMSDRKTIHGDPVMIYPPEGEGWRPFFGKLLTDSDAPQNVHDDNFFRWAIYADLQIGEVLQAIANDELGWTKQAKPFLKAIFDKRYKSHNPEEEDSSYFNDALSMVRDLSPEEYAEEGGHVGEYLDTFCTHTLKVFHFYEKDFSDPSNGVPVDLSIVARVDPDWGTEEDDTSLPDPMLYYQKAAYPSVKNCIYDFVADANLGVLDKTWTTIKGLGHLNFTPDVMINRLVSSMNNQAIDQNTPLWEVATDADIRKMEKWINQGYGANTLIPQGLSFADKSKQGMNIRDAIQVIGQLQSLSSENAIAQAIQSEAPRDELRINAGNRHQRDARVANNRSKIDTQKKNLFFGEMGRRIAQDLTQRDFDGEAGEQMEWLRSELTNEGVQWEYFFPDNVEITYSRLNGDGDPEQRLQIASVALQNIGLIPPDQRNEVLMEWWAALTGDWEQAERFYGRKDGEAPTDQVVKAMSKAGAMMELGQPFPIEDDDVPEQQLPVLVGILEKVKNEAVQVGYFEPAKAQGAIAVGQHAMLLVQRLEQIGQKQIANFFGQEIQRISTEARAPIANMQKRQEAMQDPSNQIDQAKLQLQAQAEQRKGLEFQEKVRATQTREEMAEQRQLDNKFLQMNQLELQKKTSQRKELEAEQKILTDRLAALDSK